MTAAAVGHDEAEHPTCWCCGNMFAEHELTRLGAHPEVGVCARCAQWLHRRARSASHEGGRSRGALVKTSVDRVRARVVRAGAQDWPVVGRLLRRLDRHLP